MFCLFFSLWSIMNKMRLYDICKHFLVLFNKVSPFWGNCTSYLQMQTEVTFLSHTNNYWNRCVFVFFLNQLSSFPINSLSLTKVVSVFSLFSLLVDQAWSPMIPQETGEASLWKEPDIFPWNWFQSVSRWQASYPTEQAWHSGTQIGCKLVTHGYRDSAVWWTEQELSTRNLCLQRLCIWQ